jgi:hypothetical protein
VLGVRHALAESPTDEPDRLEDASHTAVEHVTGVWLICQNVLRRCEERVLLLQTQPGGLTCRTTSAFSGEVDGACGDGPYCARRTHRAPDVWGPDEHSREDREDVALLVSRNLFCNARPCPYMSFSHAQNG